MRADADRSLAGRQVLQIGDSRFSGTVVRCGIHKATLHARIVGGAGGLASTLAGKGYIGTPVKVPLQDIAREAGETLAPSCESAVTLVNLGHWLRMEGAGGQQLQVLLDAVPGATWRFLPSGELWVGIESWPAASPVVELTDYDPFADRIDLFSLAPGILPGTAFLGRRVSYVEHHLAESGVRTSAWFEAST